MTPPELIPKGVPLSSVPGLAAAQIKTLRDSWLLTAQELVALHQTNEDLRVRLAGALGVPRAALDDIAHGGKSTDPRYARPAQRGNGRRSRSDRIPPRRAAG